MSDEQSMGDIVSDNERLAREVGRLGTLPIGPEESLVDYTLRLVAHLQARLDDTSRRERVWRRLHDAHAAGGYEALVQAVLPEAWAKGEVPDWGPLIAKVAGAIERERLLRAAAQAVTDSADATATSVAVGNLAAVLGGNAPPHLVARLLAPEKPAEPTGEGDGA